MLHSIYVRIFMQRIILYIRDVRQVTHNFLTKKIKSWKKNGILFLLVVLRYYLLQ
jgi:hypothetical protein